MEIWKKLKTIGKPAAGHHPPLYPSRILAALMAAVKRDQKVFRDMTVIPDHYTVSLANQDFSDLDPIRNALADELTDELQRHARRRGFRFNTPEVSVILQQRDRMTPGSVTVEGRFRPLGEAMEQPLETPRPPEATTTFHPIILNIAPDSPAPATVPLEPGVYTIGRGKNVDIRVPATDRLASKQHCRIIVEDGTVSLIDLKSANGTLCNRMPVTGRIRLKHNDQLRVGATCIEVLFE